MAEIGVLAGMGWGASVGIALLVFLALAFVGAPLVVHTIAAAVCLWAFGAPEVVWLVAGIPLVVMNIPSLRQWIVTSVIVKILRALNFMPVISETERVALEAGATWVEGELFSGKPNFARINKEKYQKVSAEERAFLDGPVEKVCGMISDWEVYKNGDFPSAVWDFLKKEGFFGMIVPKKYGGHEFSAIGHSEVISKLSSRCIPLGITVMVPNSLGPAELINHYGTQQQKDYYLPRLAVGQEIPCFALTEPEAGSDAGSISSSGELFKGEDGKLYIRLNWDKRYITLAAIATIVGLAIRLRDPHNLLGKGEDLGITCVLVPANAKGVILGQRHNPMGVPFYNCPTRGENVIVSIDQIIGGKDGAGRGWQMLMECLAAGRSISLPALGTTLAKATAHVTSGYSFVRRQFGMPIGKFEGIEEKLARITGVAYMAEAARIYTCGAVDSGIKPAVVSAIMKYNTTELGRMVVNDGMDILGGAAISRGPRNTLANAYIANPIAITVEGANILTRTMIIFGQGAIRCHPYAYKELKAMSENNVRDFDRAFWGHIGFVIRNSARSILLSLTRGRLALSVPGGAGRVYYQKLAWSSASFAILADIAMGMLGGQLKFKEKLTGRFADVLMWMYFASATLRRFEEEGRKKEFEPVLHWSMQYCFANIQAAFDGLFENFDVPVLGAILRGPVAFWSRLNRFSGQPSDHLGQKIVKQIMQPGIFRDALTEGLYVPKTNDPIGNIERAFKLVYESEAILKKINAAIRAKKLPKERPLRLIDRALALNIISREEADVLKNAEKARSEAIQVDSFSLHEYQTAHLESAPA